MVYPRMVYPRKAAGYPTAVDHPMACRRRAAGCQMAAVPPTGASPRQAAVPTAEALARSAEPVAPLAGAGAAADAATWEAGWPSNSCCSTTGDSDSTSSSSC